MNYLKTKLISTLIGLLVYSSCTTNDHEVSTLSDIRVRYKGNDLRETTKQVYIVAALEGCGACVDYTIRFIKRNINNKHMTFIISGRSRKELSMKFDDKTIANTNFIFDNKLVALKEQLIDTVHPKVYLLEENKIINSFEVNYSNADSLFNVTQRFAR